MSVPTVVLRDMEENFPHGRKPAKLRERASLVKDKRVKELLLNLSRGIKRIRIDKTLDELLYSRDNASKALLLIALYYPVVLSSKNPTDPEAASMLLDSRIILQKAGLKKAAENVSKELRKLGRLLIGAISEVAEEEYAKQAARAAIEIGKATGDEYLKAFGIELLRALGENIDEEYELEEEEKLEVLMAVGAALITLGRFEEVKSMMERIDIPHAQFIRAIAAILSDDRPTRGSSVTKLESMEGPEAKFFRELLEAVRCAYIGDEKGFSEAIKKARELLGEVPELVGVLEFIEKLKA